MIAYEENGILCLVIPSEKHVNKQEELANRILPKGTPFILVENVPIDRSFRNAWKIDGKAIGVDKVKAAEITKERLRRERAPLLADLDIQMMRLIETGGRIEPIVAEKQRLRDITSLATPALSLEEMKSLTCKGESK